MRKQRNKLKVIATVLIVLLILTVNPGRLVVKGNGYYSERLFFDNDGNFYMTTYDIKAAKSTRYCTLGWTIKRYDLPLDDPENMYTSIALTCDGSVVDPENEQYLYSYFHCDKDTIFEAIGSASSEWQRELYMDGGTVYLDGIMTVIENDVVLGSLSSNGNRSGEVYDTYEGIVSARNWGSKSKDSLRTHFNKSVSFPSVKEFFDEENGEFEEIRENGSIMENFYWWGPELQAGITVSATDYDPEVAIPAGESVILYAWQQGCAYNVGYEKVSGWIPCEVPIIIVADKTEMDENGQQVIRQVSVFEGTYSVMVPYTYYALGGVEVYCSDGITVTCDAFEETIYLDTYYNPDIITTVYNGDEHILCEPVTEPVSVYIGTLTDENEIEEYVKAAAEGVANKPMVRNDYLSIGEGIIMHDEWSETASEPTRVSVGGGDMSVNIKIPASTPNAEYEIKAKARYTDMVVGWFGESITRVINDTGKIVVHTPVVCYGKTEDVKEWNQAETPDLENPTLVLGKEFSVSVSNEGKHIDAKGYGTRDYKKYVLYNQVRFPFDVFIEEGEFVSADTWIELKPKTKFVLPVTVPEGEYDVEFRAVASNFAGDSVDDQYVGENANLSPNEQAAEDTVKVKVIGQLFGFELTELIEYKSIVDLEEHMGKCDVSKLPHMWNEGLPLGSYFRFRLKSVGGYDKGAKITIVPTFWYIDDEVPIEADIYYEDIRYDGKIVLKKWNTENHVIELTEEDCQIINNSVVEGGKDGQDYERYQLWSGTYMLPMKSFCLLKDRSLPLYGVDKRSFIKDGQILVKFDIRIEDENGENVLLYINSENAEKGYCNRWQGEGGNDGEVIFYNIGESVRDSMKVRGTH